MTAIEGIIALEVVHINHLREHRPRREENRKENQRKPELFEHVSHQAFFL